MSGARDRLLWRSLDELEGRPEFERFLAAEFPAIARMPEVDRRGALRVMGAALALAGLTGCDQPEARSQAARAAGVPGHTPGEPLWFATTLELDGYGRGVLVETRDGRPLKIEGNPLHPASLGATDAFAQAEVLSLYDPDRARFPREGNARRSWNEFVLALAIERAALAGRGGDGLRILTGPVTSPTTGALLERVLARYPRARWHQHSPIGDENAHAGARAAFGEVVETVYDFSQAEVVLALDADPLGAGPAHVRYARDFAERRRSEAGVQRVYAVESSPSLTGARADHRIVVRPGDVLAFGRAIAAGLDVVAAVGEPPGDSPLVQAVIDDLRRAGERGLVIAGRSQPPAVHALAHAINARQGAIGRTVSYIAPVTLGAGDAAASLGALVEDMAAGAVTHLLILDGNPAYTAPADLEFAAHLARVPFTVHLGPYDDETGALCRWQLPKAHALESWGDARAFDGTASLRQPARIPAPHARSLDEVLSLLTGEPASGHDLLRAFWRSQWGEGAFDERWVRALHDGVIAGSALPAREVRLRDDWHGALQTSPPPRAGFDVTFAPDPSVWDGRFANNAWLQELPRPLTKLVWDNAALLAPETAAQLELEKGDVIELELDGRSLFAAVWVMPGQAPAVITLPLGYGRTQAGEVGTGVGFDAYRLRSSERPWLGHGARITRTGLRHEFASTQHHHSMAGRDLVRTATLAELQADPSILGDPQVERPSIYPDWPYPGHAWGMAIDLDACIGCNACAIACQAENNVPVVGKEEVGRGREMHWLRVDRYYEGLPGDPATYFQPVLCMHCEKAPCELVCPVNATVHSSEGLNEMVYNRCIGTRTCSNNCPYKVRRFNFFAYAHEDLARPAEAFNPEVSVRARGVMEKCTYCVQRISAARIEAKQEGRRIRDGEIVTACQQACPTRAIVFGDVNDPDSAVSRLKGSARNYALLGDLNTRPRTTYLARIANPHAQPATAETSGPPGERS